MHKEATKFNFSEGRIKTVLTKDGEEYQANQFISGIHPYQTMEMIEQGNIRKAYRNRLQNLSNTMSTFSLHIALEDRKIPYMNYNYYYYPMGDVWGLTYYDPGEFPQCFGIYPIADSMDEKYTRGMSVLAFMDYDEVLRWENNRVEERGEEYEAFKEAKSIQILSKLKNIFPEIHENIKSYSSSTPLTLRDYTGTHRGATYGIERDYRFPNNSLLFPGTKVPNLFLTGQNLSLHGMLGVSIGALLTCSEFINLNELLKEINYA
ncbi:hypothetical protein ES703_96873 [subsurface metagenome]